MNPQDAMQKIAPIASAVIGELLRVGEQHSCIFAGALLTKVLRRLGYSKAYAVTVRAFIFNPQLHEWVKANGSRDIWENEAEWSALGGKGAILGGTASGKVPEGLWAGHMAVIIPNHFDDRHAMLDLTITQSHRPEYGMRLQPMLVRVPDSFVTGETEFKAAPLGSLVVYKAFPDDHSYDGSVLWKDQSRYDAVADRIAATVA